MKAAPATGRGGTLGAEGRPRWLGSKPFLGRGPRVEVSALPGGPSPCLWRPSSPSPVPRAASPSPRGKPALVDGGRPHAEHEEGSATGKAAEGSPGGAEKPEESRLGRAGSCGRGRAAWPEKRQARTGAPERAGQAPGAGAGRYLASAGEESSLARWVPAQPWAAGGGAPASAGGGGERAPLGSGGRGAAGLGGGPRGLPRRHLKGAAEGRSSPSPRGLPIGRGMYPLWNVDARRVPSLV